MLYKCACSGENCALQCIHFFDQLFVLPLCVQLLCKMPRVPLHQLLCQGLCLPVASPIAQASGYLSVCSLADYCSGCLVAQYSGCLSADSSSATQAVSLQLFNQATSPCKSFSPNGNFMRPHKPQYTNKSLVNGFFQYNMVY